MDQQINQCYPPKVLSKLASEPPNSRYFEGRYPGKYFDPRFRQRSSGILWYAHIDKCILEKCRSVKIHYERFRDNVEPGKLLPIDRDDALGTLGLLSIDQMPEYIKHLTVSPHFRQWWAYIHVVPWLVTIPHQVLVFEHFPKQCLIQVLRHPDRKSGFDHVILAGFLDDHSMKNSLVKLAT